MISFKKNVELTFIVLLTSVFLAKINCQNKVAHKILEKWATVLNFINILQIALEPILFC
jgi:hypothetical protein